jgi:RimJ/RimL family protein N-acetyltransferase
MLVRRSEEAAGVTAQHPAPTEERLLTPRLELAPVVADDAEELTEVFADERLYVFLGSHPITTEELRAQFDRLAAARLANQEGTAQRNWTVRRRADSRAVGMVQAAFSDQGRAAEIAWAVGVAWQGQGIASEAALAVVGWLERRGVATITAHIHPDHHASAKVATRAGLRPTGAIRSQAGQRALPRSAATAALTSLHTHDGIVDVPQGTLPPADVLDRIYSDQALITRFNG